MVLQKCGITRCASPATPESYRNVAEAKPRSPQLLAVSLGLASATFRFYAQVAGEAHRVVDEVFGTAAI
jgi:hypothetical protein